MLEASLSDLQDQAALAAAVAKSHVIVGTFAEIKSGGQPLRESGG
jgi:hypothetical protein